MLRVALGAVMLLAAAVAQATWMANLEVAGAFPNLVLLAIVAVAWVEGARPAMALACAGGLLLDLMSPGPVGPHAFALVAVAYLAGFWSRNLDRHGAIYVALSAAAGTVLYSAVLAGFNWVFGLPVPALDSFGWLTLAACAYNALLMPIAAGVARRLNAVTQGTVQPV